MPTTITCDGGCGAANSEEFVKTKHGLERYYCQKCFHDAEAFYLKRNLLHSEVAQKWRDGLAELETEWRNAHPDGVLPDA